MRLGREVNSGPGANHHDEKKKSYEATTTHESSHRVLRPDYRHLRPERIHEAPPNVPISSNEKQNGTPTRQRPEALRKRMRSRYQNWVKSKQILLHLGDTLSSRRERRSRLGKKRSDRKLVARNNDFVFVETGLPRLGKRKGSMVRIRNKPRRGKPRLYFFSSLISRFSRE
jgi:hypothetical protein